MPFFSRFKSRGAQSVSKSKSQADLVNGKSAAAQKPQWQSTWNSKVVVPEEVEELIHLCTVEMKSRAQALNAPFLLLPFRPDSDASSSRAFIRNFYKDNAEGSTKYRGSELQSELRFMEPVVLCSIIKWCWSRMPNGLVSWPVYEGFLTGERESNMARDAFTTFIPIGAESRARTNIIYDFFELLAAVAAHGKLNGLGGRKLSRLAGWWAFEHSDDGKGFEGGYKSWTAAADASSHLFFAYLRSLSPEADPSMSVIERIPRSLQSLLASTEYPPETPTLLQRSTPKVVMMVDTVSPTPFALLRRAKHFEYRDKDKVLRKYSEFDDPLEALTDECKRVLYAISTTNSSASASRRGNPAKTQESWSAFQNLGFSDVIDENAVQQAPDGMNGNAGAPQQGLRSEARSRNADHGRPTTPSWADFMNAGFNDEDVNSTSPLVLPRDKYLLPMSSRSETPSHTIPNMGEEHLAPGELAAITNVELDDAFWWVWMTSLAREEPAERKAVFGRCALVETNIGNGKWLIMEEQVKGASPDPAEAAFIAPKQSSIFSFTKRGRNKKAKSEKGTANSTDPIERVASATPSKASLAPDQQTKIKAAAAALARRGKEYDVDRAQRRGRHDDAASMKTTSMLTMGMLSDASPALKWAHAYDTNTTRSKYLGDEFAGKGNEREGSGRKAPSVNSEAPSVPALPVLSPEASAFPIDRKPERQLPALPQKEATKPAALQAGPETVNETPASRAPAAPKSMPLMAASGTNALPVDAAEVQGGLGRAQQWDTARAEPAISPLEKELAVQEPSSPNRLSRKPVPRSDSLRDHPAFRPKSDEEPVLHATSGPVSTTLPMDFQPAGNPQSPPLAKAPSPPTNVAAIAAQRAMAVKQEPSSPESQKSQSQAKPRKLAGGAGGVRNLFGRRKEKESRDAVETVPPSSNSLAPPPEANLRRRLSLMRGKPAKSSGVIASSNESHNATSQPAVVSPPIQEPSMPSSLPNYEGNDISREVSREDANPAQEFSRFDQGPMADMPAVEPIDSHSALQHETGHAQDHEAAHEAVHEQEHGRENDYEDENEHEYHHGQLPAPTPQRHFNTLLAGRIAPTETSGDSDGFVTPMERGDPVNDVASETTMEEQHPEVLPEKDRWAQIRENAARRAAMASEEQNAPRRPAPSARETDDGETSGEETIESRVARIKARVAELTGGMDGGAVRR